MLAVRWGQLKIGPTLRRQRDARLYLSLFLQHPAYVSGLERKTCFRVGLQRRPKTTGISSSTLCGQR